MDMLSLEALLISLAIALVLAFPLAKALRAHPAPFYAVALAVVAVYVGLVWNGVNLNNHRALTFVLQKGYLSSILLGIVMFTGCLDNGSALKRRWFPVRGELSILSFIFILGHVAVFAPSYLKRIFGGLALKPNVAASLTVAFVLTALFIVLGVTSFKVVRRHMSTRVWKNVQRFAYLMVALYLVHVGFVLGAAALAGRGTASFATYVLAVVAYAALRVGKAVRDRRGHAASGASASDEG